MTPRLHTSCTIFCWNRGISGFILGTSIWICREQVGLTSNLWPLNFDQLDSVDTTQSVTIHCINTVHQCTHTHTHTHTHTPTTYTHTHTMPFTHTQCLASFPGLHAQLLSLAVRKAGEGLDGFITWCVSRLTSCSVCSRLGLFSPLRLFFPDFSSFFLFSLSCESDCYWIDRG